ncbi:DltE protein [Mycobacterium bohemicum DSM 44277]|uniref:Oxidoreductase n=2 Tax=Mycobacterium bohemicum TaxID=56425 RepID=A0A1X1QX75_MYCBE|nr:SDR family NAD(P)-dependent oxidoreductase [Mycobacterium bohemicum]MCV6968820.1 SDR family oxidoreductase [Mycobacterium bohemicum]ORU95985.1 oxidoreductase [Mycobacterium bohemicum]CPR09829.1 DltE protein [Mycobacterium bohemicum DSM 44277]
MNLTGNTVLVTGGASGIGRGLAESLHRAGNQVVIAGRRRDALRAVADANPGMECRRVDLAEPAGIDRLAAELRAGHPGLNVLVNNAGIMLSEDLLAGQAALAGIAEATVAVNLLGPMRLTAALLPTLLGQPHAAIVNVTSALAFVPKAVAPTYSATKAGLHSYTQSLRRQLRHTCVQVIEIIPPRVETDMLAGQDRGPDVMALNDFVAQTMSLLRGRPDATEIVVGGAERVRFAARGGRYDAVFESVNP